MPFRETGTQELLDRTELALSEQIGDAAQATHIVITLGTPSFSHIEIDISQIRVALDELRGALHAGQSLILRSTVAPGTTDFVAAYLRRHTSFESATRSTSPTRPSGSPPGASSRRSTRCRASSAASEPTVGAAVGELFAVFGAPIVQTTPVQAELAKIWTNILRYTTFALPNLLMMDCEQYDANVFEVIELINRDYPRGGIASPGFTAGTCLRKDFAFSEERSYAPGMLLAVSRVNESVPLFLIRGLHRRIGSLEGRRVCVLGLAFKADTDDERDSLAHKLVRLLERELADVVVHDPLVQADTSSFEDAVSDADAVIVATNHSAFRTPHGARRDRRRERAGLPDRRPLGLLGTSGSCSSTPPSCSSEARP